MEFKLIDQTFSPEAAKRDSIDTPECYGEYDKRNKLCTTYCTLSIKCCVLHARQPKIDILEKLLINNQYAVKPH